MHHIVVIMPRWVGDVVMSTPLLRGLRRHFHRTRITGVLRPLALELLSGSTWFDDTIFYDRHSTRPELGFMSVVRQLRSLKPDVAIVIPNSLSSASLVFFGGECGCQHISQEWDIVRLTSHVGLRVACRKYEKTKQGELKQQKLKLPDSKYPNHQIR